MIDDLKADSARWEQERRQQSARSNTAGGIIASRESNDVHVRASNSPTVQYRNSETHSSRQYYGPTEGAQPGYSENPGYGDAPRYPGTGSPGYTGAANPQQYYAQQQAPPGSFTGQAGYSNQAPQYAPQPGSAAYPSHPPQGIPGQEPYMAGANFGARNPPPDQYAGDQFSTSRDMRDHRVPVTTMPSGSRTVYATSGPSVPANVYPTAGSNNFYPQGAPSATPQQYVQAQAQDPFFGRGAYMNCRR